MIATLFSTCIVGNGVKFGGSGWVKGRVEEEEVKGRGGESTLYTSASDALPVVSMGHG